MQFEMRVDNDRRVLPAVQAFAREALSGFPLPVGERTGIAELVVHGTEAAVEHAYPAGEEGWIAIAIRESGGRLLVSVRDYGLPPDVQALERQLRKAGPEDLADAVHWIGYGPEGKELRLSRWLHDVHVRSHADTPEPAAAPDAVAPAPAQSYEVRRMAARDAVRISQLMYRTYRGTYFNSDVYYPDRVAALNASGAQVSVVAEAEDGQLAGHYALERNQEGPVAEGGQAVVDPAHRGRGLLTRMREAVVEEARRLELVGLYADAVTVHTRTQRSELHHGGRVTGADLGIAPRSERFRGISETQAQRVTCLLYFRWLRPPETRPLHVPRRHREITRAIYANLECPVTFGREAQPGADGTMTIALHPGAARAIVRVGRIGRDSDQALRLARRALVEHSHAEVVYAELPLQDPGTPRVVVALEQDGFSFAGIAPHFAPEGDVLRLVYLTEPLLREPIETDGELEGRLVDYALSEQRRVREALD